MKKFLTILMVALLSLSFFGCQKDEPNKGKGEGEYDVVFLADLGSIYDGGFNENSFYGIRDYCEENNLKYTYLQPAGSDDTDRKNIFLQAVEQMKADVLVAVGFLWDAALLDLVPEYPDVKVIFVDADDLYDIDVDYDGVKDSIPHQDHLAMITFAEQDCGFMAGYAIVKEGFRKLAFFGGMAVPAVKRFGLGWLAGAEQAATELGLPDGSIECIYYYTGGFDPKPEFLTRVSGWYQAGTEVVFSCGGSIVSNALSAAKDGEGRWLVGVDTDEYHTRADEGKVEPLFITSAMKALEITIYNAVKAAYAGGEAWAKYSAGMQRLGAKEEASVIAPYRAENWKNFTQADYDALNQKTIDVHDSLPTEVTNHAQYANSLKKVVVTFQNDVKELD